MPYIPRAVCAKCNQGLKPHRNGVTCHMYDEQGRWYYSVMADLWKCPKCGAEIVIGFAWNPLAGRWEREKPFYDSRPEYNIDVYDY